jgi:UDP-N-acetyl-D-mannosaminouronate:lipid I N-acetyl-D-mannosaminouronosyltransferase
MQKKTINGIDIYAPSNRKELIDFAFKNKSILIAINAEKILHATNESRNIINRNIGYPDGIGALWALNKKGCDSSIKIPGCELWLDIIKNSYREKSFYLIGGKEDVIEKTVEKLKNNF